MSRHRSKLKIGRRRELKDWKIGSCLSALCQAGGRIEGIERGPHRKGYCDGRQSDCGKWFNARSQGKCSRLCPSGAGDLLEYGPILWLTCRTISNSSSQTGGRSRLERFQRYRSCESLRVESVCSVCIMMGRVARGGRRLERKTTAESICAAMTDLLVKNVRDAI